MKTYLIVGLGRFGTAVALKLQELGNEVMVPDHGNAVYTITFSDDKTMMTITPAMTSTDSVEYWFNFD